MESLSEILALRKKGTGKSAANEAKSVAIQEEIRQSCLSHLTDPSQIYSFEIVANQAEAFNLIANADDPDSPLNLFVFEQDNSDTNVFHVYQRPIEF